MVNGIINTNFSAYTSAKDCDSSDHPLNRRFEIIKLQIDSFKAEMNIDRKIQAALEDTFNSWSTNEGLINHTIIMPPADLFQYDDIPLKFRITDFDDPRLINLDFLNELAEWMNTQFKEAGLSSVVPVGKDDYRRLQGFLLLRRDPDLYEKHINFIICHELAHLQQAKEGRDFWTFVKGGDFFKFFIFLTLIVCIAATIIIFLNLVGVAVILGVIAGLLFIQSGIYFFHLNFLEAAQLQEKDADLIAVQVLNDVEGGVYYFETIRNINMKRRERDPDFNEIYDENGNYLKDKIHPLHSTRITYLRDWQNEQKKIRSVVIDPPDFDTGRF
jgi:hypothetical protein